MIPAVFENCLERELNLVFAVLEAAAEVARASSEIFSMGIVVLVLNGGVVGLIYSREVTC